MSGGGVRSRLRYDTTAFRRRDIAAWFLRRGAVPVARGALYRARLRHCAMPLALGRRVRIYHGSYLHTGPNVVLGDYCWLSCLSERGVTLGRNVTIREFGWIQCANSVVTPPGIGLTVGEGTYIGPRCYLGVGGLIEIGAHCDIGGSFTVLAENHQVPTTDRSLRGSGVRRSGIAIGDDCWIGNNVTVLDGVTIGSGVVIGANSLVTKSLPDNCVAFGSPATVVRQRT